MSAASASVDELFSPVELRSVAELIDLGFSRDQALHALLTNGWQLSAAAEQLLDQPEEEPATDPVIEATPTVAVAEVVAPRVLDKGYVVLRTPDTLSHLRGHHQCDRHELRRRLRVDPWGADRRGFYIRLYTTADQAVAWWTQQRLVLPIPVDPTARGSDTTGGGGPSSFLHR